MEKVIVLMAQGPNSLEIPCRVMKDIDAAHEFCDKLGLEPTNESRMRFRLPDLDGNPEMAKELFTNYYSGCGEAYAIVLQEVEFNTPFVGWDLD